ncbi:MAG: fructose-6-phosphate aldolase [Planctomycetes bacterium]|nr:fructose-6-phosphate aldolase [Planctomycetota bacterium]MBL7145985.1 fructose-6-phosphate aldolase [Phycisphaerae bacterium]
MKIFLDTGDVEAIKRAHDTGLLDGITTNPTHIAKTGRKFQDVVKEICGIVSGPVSVEAMADTAEGLVNEAQKAAQLAPNIAIKIPMTVEGLKAVPILEDKGIKCNVTMVFSSTQTFLAMKAGATFVSIVISRLDAVCNEGDILISDAVTIKRNFNFSSNVLAASLKTQNHVLSCLRAGVDIVTVPEFLFFQMYKHPLTDVGLAQFARDWESVPK